MINNFPFIENKFFFNSNSKFFFNWFSGFFTLCYHFHTNSSYHLILSTHFQFMYIDMFLITMFAFLFGNTPSFHRLAHIPPPTRLLSVASVTSVVGQLIIMAAAQVNCFYSYQLESEKFMWWGILKIYYFSIRNFWNREKLNKKIKKYGNEKIEKKIYAVFQFFWKLVVLYATLSEIATTKI